MHKKMYKIYGRIACDNYFGKSNKTGRIRFLGLSHIQKDLKLSRRLLKISRDVIGR